MSTEIASLKIKTTLSIDIMVFDIGTELRTDLNRHK